MPKNYDFSDFDKPAKAKSAAYDFSDFDSANAAPKSLSDYTPDPSAALQGFGEAGTFGYLPQLQAVASKLTPNPTKGVDEELKAKGFKLPEEETYVQARDSAIKREGELQSRAPGSFIGGELAGTLAGGAGLAKGLGAAGKIISGGAKPVGLLAKAGQAAVSGATQGAIQNPGDTEGKIDLSQGDERLANAKMGGALGLGTFGLAGALKKGTDLVLGLPKAAKSYAQLKAFKASGAMLKDFRNASDRGRIGKIGQSMIDQGVVEPGATFESIADKAANLKQNAGKLIGDVYDSASKELENPAMLQSISGDKAMRVAKSELNTVQFANELDSQFASELKGKAGGTKALSSVRAVLDELKMNGEKANLSTLQEFKEGLDDMIKYNRDLHQEPLSKQYLFKVRDYIKNKVQDRIGALDSALGKDRLASLKEANDQYGIWAEVSRIAKDRHQRERANQFMSLSDTIAGSAGIAGGGAAGYHQGGVEGALKGAAIGAGLGVGNKLARRYGNPLLIKGANFAGGAAGSIPVAPLKAINAPAGLLSQNPMIAGAAGAGLVRKKNESKR